jgi:hypothetical protein
MLLWTSLGVRFVTLGFVCILRPDPELAGGLLLAMLAPPAGCAVAIAAMLRLNAPLTVRFAGAFVFALCAKEGRVAYRNAYQASDPRGDACFASGGTPH